jgi:hypothetical protein
MSQDPRTAEGRGGSRTILWVAVAVIAAVLIGLGLWLALGLGEGADTVADDPGEQPTAVDGVAQFSGNGDDTTDSFEVAGNWQIEWETSGESFQVELFTEDGSSRGVIVDSAGEAEGGTFVTEGGKFYLEVTADDDWTILILDGGGE